MNKLSKDQAVDVSFPQQRAPEPSAPPQSRSRETASAEARDRSATARAASDRVQTNLSRSAEIVFEPTRRETRRALRFLSREPQNRAARAACERFVPRPKRARRDFWNLPAKRAEEPSNFRRDAKRFDGRYNGVADFNDFYDYRDEFGAGIA